LTYLRRSNHTAWVAAQNTERTTVNLSGLFNLWDMLRIYAPKFVDIGERMKLYLTSSYDPNAIPDQKEYSDLLHILEEFKEDAESLQLPVATTSAKKIILEFSTSAPRQAVTRDRFNEWYSCFKTELESTTVMLVYPHRAGYYSDQEGSLGTEINSLFSVLGNFPEAIYDAREAGNCFAFERFTAAVYHLMRVAEYGLVSVAASAGVAEDKRTSWASMLAGIHGEIKQRVSKHTADYKTFEKVYGGRCPEVRWRLNDGPDHSTPLSPSMRAHFCPELL
jgi:hypothetical protein